MECGSELFKLSPLFYIGKVVHTLRATTRVPGEARNPVIQRHKGLPCIAWIFSEASGSVPKALTDTAKGPMVLSTIRTIRVRSTSVVRRIVDIVVALDAVHSVNEEVTPMSL